MYEGTIKATIIAGRTRPEMSATMSGNAYKKDEKITFNELIRANNHLWARRDDEYILLASGNITFVDYIELDADVFNNNGGIHSDKNENPTGYIPVNLMEVIKKTRDKTHSLLIAKQGETNELKDQYIFWYSSQRRLNNEDVQPLTTREVTIARNEIYARHGKEFKTEWLQTYFENTSWYKKSREYNYKDEKSNLSALEVSNVEFLSNVEQGLTDTNDFNSKVAGSRLAGSAEHDTYLIWYSSTQLLTWGDLKWVEHSESKSRTLELMECEIYARHGKTFEDKAIQEYFESTSWYVPKASYDDSQLSHTEAANARFLREYRQGNIDPTRTDWGGNKTAIDYLNSYGIVDYYFASAANGNNVHWDEDRGTFVYQNRELFQNGETTRNININGVVYRFEVDNSQQYRFGDTVTSGVGVTNTQSGEYMIIGPGGTIFDRTSEGVQQTGNQRSNKTYTTKDPETGEIIVNLAKQDGESLLDAYTREEYEARKEQEEAEALAYQQFAVYGGQVQDYIRTLEQGSSDESVLKRSMRLFGCPYQFTRATDPRWASVSKDIGRKFAENILIEAPIVSIIPGIPRYLGGKSKEVKNSTTLALMEGSHENFGHLKSIIQKNPSKYLRYYDFQARYTDYMKYVNILCRTAATFLEVFDENGEIVKLDDGSGKMVPLTQFDWRNYRSDRKDYNKLTADLRDNIGDALKKAGYNGIKKIKKITKIWSDGSVETSYDSTEAKMSDTELDVANQQESLQVEGVDNTTTQSAESTGTTEPDEDAVVEVNSITQEYDVVDAARGYFSSTGTGNIVSYDEEGNEVVQELGKDQFVYQTTTSESEEFESILEDLLQHQNYVQFMVDPDISVTESYGNSVGESQFKGLFDGISSQMKEMMFMAQSGGMDLQGMEEFLTSSSDALSSLIDKTFSGGVSSMFSRLISVGGNVLRGENMIFPQIYQSSDCSKQYSITVHLKAESGSKLSYYMDVVVPLMHLLALALPRQTTSNTYGSPFLVKFFVEGLISCNLGMVTDISINKNVAPEGWTIEGLPNEVDVTLQITDLYSDLTMSPQNEPSLFLNNSSLIEYLATTCGLSIISPQLSKKWDLYVNAYSGAVRDIYPNVKHDITEKIGNFFQEMTALYR